MGDIGTLREYLCGLVSRLTRNVYPGYADVFIKYPAVIVDVTDARITEAERYTAQVVVVAEKREEADELATKIKSELSNRRKGGILVLYTGMTSGYREIGNTLYCVITLTFTVYLLGGV